MFDYRKYFDDFCKENSLDIALSFDMPEGYETANGTFNFETKTVFINTELLNARPDHEKAYYLFHEMRHALQYLRPDLFSDAIVRSLRYVILYDGTCFKLIDGKYSECKIDGDSEYLSALYLGQPYEVDANRFAYEMTESIYGDSGELHELFKFWMPDKLVPKEIYDSVFAVIDEKVKNEKKQDPVNTALL